MERTVMQGLHSSEYEHPMDRTTLEALRRIPVVPKLLEIIDIPMNSVARLDMFGSNLRANDRQFPTIYGMMCEACRILDMEVPILYISSQPTINAYTACPDKPIICLYSYLVDMLSPDELMFVIGHELGHIKSQHIVYKNLGVIIGNNMLDAILASIPGGNIVGQAATLALNYAYFEWYRTAEYTSDRGGYLACQDLRASCTALMKLAGSSKEYMDELNLDEFIQQSREFKQIDSSALGIIQKIYLSQSMSHPWAVSRVNELLMFNDSGQYEDVLNRRTKRTPDDNQPPAIGDGTSTAVPSTTTPGASAGLSASFTTSSGIMTGATLQNAAKGAFSGLAKGIKKFTTGDQTDTAPGNENDKDPQ